MDISKLSDSDLQQIAKGDLRMVSEEGLRLLASTQATPQTQAPKQNAGSMANIIAGGFKGASDIGATLLRPVDWALNKTGLTETTNEQRRQSLQDFFAQNFDPQSMAFKGGELAADVAGTAGVGGVLAKGAMAVPALARFAPALESGGFRLGTAPAKTAADVAKNIATRVGAGGIVGGTQAGMINPDQAATGLAIGAALPPSVMAAGKLGQLARKGVTQTLGGITGVGPEAVSQAYQAGKAGEKTFVENMRGKVDFGDIVDQAKQALGTMRQARGDAYRSGMINIKGDKTVLDFAPINSAVQNIKNIGTFKGKAIQAKASSTVDDIANLVDDWAAANPAEYHTPEGLDALKQAIGDIRDSTQFGTSARKAADSAYNAVKDQITKQAPTYSKVMKDYQAASETLSELEKALSLGNKAARDTAVRKLQSVLRNNVNTSFGNRLELVKQLEQQGGANILPAIAGQSMASFLPRGLAGQIERVGIPATALLTSNPYAMLAALPTSPRLVGESAYGLGRALGGMGGMAQQPFGAIQGAMPGLLSAMPAIGRTVPVLMPSLATP